MATLDRVNATAVTPRGRDCVGVTSQTTKCRAGSPLPLPWQRRSGGWVSRPRRAGGPPPDVTSCRFQLRALGQDPSPRLAGRRPRRGALTWAAPLSASGSSPAKGVGRRPPLWLLTKRSASPHCNGACHWPLSGTWRVTSRTPGSRGMAGDVVFLVSATPLSWRHVAGGGSLAPPPPPRTELGGEKSSAGCNLHPTASVQQAGFAVEAPGEQEQPLLGSQCCRFMLICRLAGPVLIPATSCGSLEPALFTPR